MKKTLIALAALASISAFAQATPGVTVYGLIDISYMKDSAGGSRPSDNRVQTSW